MRNYVLYRITFTVQLLLFFFFTILTMNPNRAQYYGNNYGPPDSACTIAHGSVVVLDVLALIIIVILNDFTVVTIASDHVLPAKQPQQWDLTEVRSAGLQLLCVTRY